MEDGLSSKAQGRAGGLVVILILAFGTFAVGTDAFIVARFLPALARTLAVSVATAEQSVTVFALTYAVLAPVLATLTARVPRRSLLVGALVVIGSANLGAAIASEFTMLVFLRALAAAGAAMYTPTAASLVSPSERGRVLAFVVGGLTLATVLSVPLGVLMSGWVGWRVSLGIVAALAFLGALAVSWVLPVLGGALFIPLRERLGILGQSCVVSVLPLTVLGMMASYTVYAYSVPALRAAGPRL